MHIYNHLYAEYVYKIDNCLIYISPHGFYHMKLQPTKTVKLLNQTNVTLEIDVMKPVTNLKIIKKSNNPLQDSKCQIP